MSLISFLYASKRIMYKTTPSKYRKWLSKYRKWFTFIRKEICAIYSQKIHTNEVHITVYTQLCHMHLVWQVKLSNIMTCYWVMACNGVFRLYHSAQSNTSTVVVIGSCYPHWCWEVLAVHVSTCKHAVHVAFSSCEHWAFALFVSVKIWPLAWPRVCNPTLFLFEESWRSFRFADVNFWLCLSPRACLHSNSIASVLLLRVLVSALESACESLTMRVTICRLVQHYRFGHFVAGGLLLVSVKVWQYVWQCVSTTLQVLLLGVLLSAVCVCEGLAVCVTMHIIQHYCWSFAAGSLVVCC